MCHIGQELDNGNKPDTDAWFVLGFLARDKHCTARPIAVLSPAWVRNMILQSIAIHLTIKIQVMLKEMYIPPPVLHIDFVIQPFPPTMSQFPMSEFHNSTSALEPKGQSDQGQEKSHGFDPSNMSPPMATEVQNGRRKFRSFYLASVALLLMVFLVSLDATTLAVTIFWMITNTFPYTVMEHYTHVVFS